MNEHHHHDHEHGHHHPKQPDLEDQPITYYKVMTEALADLLVEKGIFSADELRAQMEQQDTRAPIFGAKLIARAWKDEAFKARLIADVNGAAAEMDIDAGDIPIRGVENTDDVHNVVVCTLCSCYPRSLIGLPPDWYKSKSYRSRAVIEPRSVLKEFGTEVPADKTVRVHDSNADMRYLVLPQQPDGTENWSADKLAEIVSRDAMVGVVLPTAG